MTSFLIEWEYETSSYFSTAGTYGSWEVPIMTTGISNMPVNVIPIFAFSLFTEKKCV